MSANDILDRVVSSTELARLTGADLRYVARQTRRLGMRPVYSLGERQWSRADALKLILLARLQAVFGETSPLPFEIAAVAGPEIGDLLQAPGRGTELPIPATGLRLSVRVPPLAELVREPAADQSSGASWAAWAPWAGVAS